MNECANIHADDCFLMCIIVCLFVCLFVLWFATCLDQGFSIGKSIV
jgi:hypothetical protein